jgi:hypothetical protein
MRKSYCKMCEKNQGKIKRKFEKVYCKNNQKEKVEFYLCNLCNKFENIFILPSLTEKEEPYIFVSLNYGNF